LKRHSRKVGLAVEVPVTDIAAQTFTVAPDQAGQTVAAFLRARLPGQSWNAVRRLIDTRRVRVLGELCLDPARRLRGGESVDVLARPLPKPHADDAVVIRHIDTHVVVVEKPSGMATVRHPAERDWPARRKALHPTLEDVLPPLIAVREGKARRGPLPRLRIVHRLDKDTSGLVVFARTVPAESALGAQFKAHTVLRRYLAVVQGRVQPQRIETRLVRDRGDGRRGSSTLPNVGKPAVTHVGVEERLGPYTLVACRLETGRTHQIRIHLAEIGHPVCGERVYLRRPGGEAVADTSGAPRLALHATELGFVHPISNVPMHWAMPLPADLRTFAERLRQQARPPEGAGGGARQ
jgi:23S rRNA pseudouridine1911/1915/1917 synthase